MKQQEMITINEISEHGHTTHQLAPKEAIQKLQELSGTDGARWVYVNNNLISQGKLAELALTPKDKVVVSPSIMGGYLGTAEGKNGLLTIDSFVQVDPMADGNDFEFSGASTNSKFLAVVELIPASEKEGRSTMTVIFHVAEEEKDTLIHYRSAITQAFQKALDNVATKELSEFRKFKNV